MRGGVGGGLFGHPVRQHAGEQEVPGHHDLPRAQQAAPLQALGHVRPGQRDEGGLGQRVVPALPQQPRGLDHVRVGVGSVEPRPTRRTAGVSGPQAATRGRAGR